jgi:hypothetical protein
VKVEEEGERGEKKEEKKKRKKKEKKTRRCYNELSYMKVHDSKMDGYALF